jgi:hypothetical protein
MWTGNCATWPPRRGQFRTRVVPAHLRGAVRSALALNDCNAFPCVDKFAAPSEWPVYADRFYGLGIVTTVFWRHALLEHGGAAMTGARDRDLKLVRVSTAPRRDGREGWPWTGRRLTSLPSLPRRRPRRGPSWTQR